jgi:CHAT domain-containing protein
MLAEGEGIISLARGFTATGAGGIVAGLWNMNDEATASVMETFYHHLSRHESPSSALYAAKKKWLNDTHEQGFKKLPYFWAGVIYVGDDQPVALQTRDKLLPLLSIAGMMLVLLATVYFLWRVRRV